jgi:hypothetical protein
VRHIVFIARAPSPSGGGGGGGNRHAEPIRHAEAVGSDPMTLRIVKLTSAADRAEDVTALSKVLLAAEPLAAGNIEQIGLSPWAASRLEQGRGPVRAVASARASEPASDRGADPGSARVQAVGWAAGSTGPAAP